MPPRGVVSSPEYTLLKNENRSAYSAVRVALIVSCRVLFGLEYLNMYSDVQ